MIRLLRVNGMPRPFSTASTPGHGRHRRFSSVTDSIGGKVALHAGRRISPIHRRDDMNLALSLCQEKNGTGAAVLYFGSMIFSFGFRRASLPRRSAGSAHASLIPSV